MNYLIIFLITVFFVGIALLADRFLNKENK